MPTETIMLPNRTSLVVKGSKAAFRRLHRTKYISYIGINGLGDAVYDLARLPREQIEKRLYLHEFTKVTPDGASHRIYVADAP